MDRKIVDIDAELERDGIIQKVKLRFLLRPITVESGVVLRYEIDKSLGFAPGKRIGDGNCMLRYVYEGKQEDWKKYRVERGNRWQNGKLAIEKSKPPGIELYFFHVAVTKSSRRSCRF